MPLLTRKGHFSFFLLPSYKKKCLLRTRIVLQINVSLEFKIKVLGMFSLWFWKKVLEATCVCVHKKIPLEIRLYVFE